MDREYLERIIEDLYSAKDKAPKNVKESVQVAIDLLDELVVGGSIYLDEEE